MRNILLILLFISSISFAQTGINYQGAATDSQGNKLENQPISLKTSILQGGIEGSASYSETHNTTTDQFGLFNVVIGLGEVLTGSFDSIQWGADVHYLKVELDANGGTDYSLISTTQMMSVPYAKYAESVSLPFNLDSLAISLEELESNMNVITQFFGCTEPTACNYDVDAVIDDGSCEGLLGCTDAQSSNYDVNATCDNGSCIPYIGMYGYGGVVFRVENASNEGLKIYVCNVHHQIYTPNNSGVSNIASQLSTNGYNDWVAPSSQELGYLCQNRAVIDLVGFQNGGTVTFASNDPYLGSATACNGTNNGAGPFSYPYWMNSCSQGTFSGNCCCLTSSGYFRSIRIIDNLIF